MNGNLQWETRKKSNQNKINNYRKPEARLHCDRRKKRVSTKLGTLRLRRKEEEERLSSSLTKNGRGNAQRRQSKRLHERRVAAAATGEIIHAGGKRGGGSAQRDHRLPASRRRRDNLPNEGPHCLDISHQGESSQQGEDEREKKVGLGDER